MVRAVLCVLGLAVAATGLAAFVGLGVGVWYARAKADRTVADAAARARDGADLAGKVIGLLRETATQAEADLAAARADEPAGPAARANPLARLAARQLSGNLDRARDAVGIASDAVVVIDAALNVLAAAPDKKDRLGVRPADLDRTRAGLEAAARNVRQAQAVVGAASPEQLSAVEDALGRARRLADDLDGRLAGLRAGVDETERRAGVWALRGAVAVTLLSAVGAVGQVFLARACWMGLRAGRPA